MEAQGVLGMMEAATPGVDSYVPGRAGDSEDDGRNESDSGEPTGRDYRPRDEYVSFWMIDRHPSG